MESNSEQLNKMRAKFLKKNNRTLSLEQKEALTGYLFMVPYLIGFIIFQGLPFLLTLITSFTDMRFITLDISKIRFVGLDNFLSVIRDRDFLMAVVRTLYYMALYVPITIITSIVIAYFINTKIYLKNMIRTLLFLPFVTNIVAVAMVWSLLYDYLDGPINMFLRRLGIENPPMWLIGDMPVVIPSIVIVAIWNGIGLFFVTYLAALQGIPKELYEAAEIDGANEVQKFFAISIPYLSPTTFFLIITAIITSMQNFAVVQTLTGGGPGNESTTLSLYTYAQAFQYNRMHIAATQSVYMLLMLAVITAFYWKGQKKWTYY